MSFSLLTRDQLNACVADQQRLAAQGRALTLPQVVVGRQLITREQYHQVVERIRTHLGQQEHAATGRHPAAPRPQVAFAPPPHTQSQAVMWQQAPAPRAEEIAEAARTWDDAASSVADPGYEVVAEPAPVEVHVVTPQQARDRKDTGIRSLLGIPEDAEEFDFGPYRILGEVASGGMGIIYRARASDTGQVYALKALINVENANEKQLRRFIQEAQSAMRLDHPGIVKIHDIGIFENVPYFTMDLIQGQDLHTILRNHAMTSPQLLEVVVRVCEAVHYAHEHGVIHRDLKPANVLVRASDRFPILTDFGLAKNLDSTFKLTAEGAMVGTPLFLSPEQVSGKATEVDRRCDVYGMGVMLYQILTDRLPFVGRNPYEVYKKVLEEDPTPPSQIKPQVPPDLEKVCLMALAKDRDERYPTALAMAEDLRRQLAGQPVVAKLPTPAAVARARAAPGKDKKAGGKPAPAPAARPGQDDGPSALTLAAIGALVLVIVLGLTFIAYTLLAT
ncbi:MAG: protein kinase [Planctomycetes bacterium]|nr:protein kinase [Planctomycetota bacterium]